MIYMTCLGGVWGLLPALLLVEKAQKHPLKKSYRSYFRRAQIRWVIWPSSSMPKRRGAYKIFCRGRLQSKHPHPRPWKMPYGQERGEGWRGVYTMAHEIITSMVRKGILHVIVITWQHLSGLPNANAKSQRFSYAISQIATMPPVVAPNRSSKSQIAAKYAAFWHAISQIALVSFPLVSLNRSVLNRSVFKTQTQLNRKR